MENTNPDTGFLLPLGGTTSFLMHMDRKPNEKYVISQGGTSSGKTWSILQCIIDYAIKNRGKNKTISIVGETLPKIKRGVLLDFKNILTMIGIWDDNNFHQSALKYDLFGNNIEFFSVESENRVKGPRRQVLFMNEADSIKWQTAIQLMNRTNELVYIDFNPTHYFWAHKEMLDNEAFNSNTKFIKTTYLHNELLEQSIIDFNLAIAAKDDNYKKVYVDGEVGNIEGLIFPHIKLVDEIPDTVKRRSNKQYFGIDWGYSNDPASLNQIFILGDSKNRVQEIYIDELLYKTETPNSVLAEVIKKNIFLDEYNRRIMPNLTICDSSEPKSRDELRSYKINIESAHKPPGSVNYGITLLQRADIYITKGSINTIKEFRNYTWAQTKTGETKRDAKGRPVPIDFWNHSIDNIRYVAMTEDDKKYTTKTMIPQKLGFTGA